MQQREVDVAIVGGGTAGLTARRAAKRADASVVIVDRGPLGTTCARVGCMPSKLLIAAAEAAHTVETASALGLKTTLEIDDVAVMQRVRRERDRFVGSVLESVNQIEAAGELVKGNARLIDAHTLQVDDHTTITAKTLVIATGSVPFVPPPFRDIGAVSLNNEQVFELDRLPRSVLVVGAGVIGLELGQALSRLGSAVTVVDIGDIVGPLQDPSCKRSALDAFAREFEIYLQYQLDSIEPENDGVRVCFRTAEGVTKEKQFERVLVAAGRRQNLDGLNLETAGVQFDRGRPVGWNPYTTQVADTHVFIAGDASSFRPILHEAADEGGFAGTNAARYPEVLANKRRAPLAVVFTDPQLATVGTRFSEMNCETHRVGTIDYGSQGRARVMNKNRGVVRIYGEAGSELLLGAEMVGPAVEHTAHLLAWAIQQRLTVSEALDLPYYHPVVEEGIRTGLRELQAALRTARAPGSDCTEFGPGT